MLKQFSIVGLILALLVVGLIVGGCAPISDIPDFIPPPLKGVETAGYKITGPYTYRNLAIYLIHGKDISKEEYITLDEAIMQKQVMVYESNDYKLVEVENLSDKTVYIQAGSIVKGGRQDRAIARDLVLLPHSGRCVIDVFCIESSRWNKRGNESLELFNISDRVLLIPNFPLNQWATERQKDEQQDNIWREIGKQQEKLSNNLGEDAKDKVSPSSYQLTLENKKLQEKVEAYINTLSKVTVGQSDVVGCAFAINGKLVSMDIYSSNALFNKLWLKLLGASAVESIADEKKDLKFEIPQVDAIKLCFEDIEKGKATEINITDQVKMIMQETDKNLLFDTKVGNQTIHKNYIVK